MSASTRAAILTNWANATSVDVVPLVAHGQFFALATGTPWTAIEASDFNLYGRYLTEGWAAIRPVVQQRVSLGYNLLRVWMLYDVEGIGHLIPSEHPEFYQQLPPFLAQLGAFGLKCELTVFTGTSRLMPSREAQQAHLDAVCAAVRVFNGSNIQAGYSKTLIEVGNEWDQGDDAWFLDLNYPTDLLLSAGSVRSDTWPTELGLPILQYQVWHGNAAGPEWMRKTAHEPMAMADDSGVPAMANENPRFSDQENSTQHAYDAAAGAALLCAGSCFHSVNGKVSQLWTGDELACAEAWAQGALSVPLQCQQGDYKHRADLEQPQDLRVYQRGDDAVCIVEIRK